MRTELALLTALSLFSCSPAATDPVAPTDGEPGGDVPVAEPTLTAEGTPSAAPTATAAPQGPLVACTKMGCMDGLEITLSPETPKAGAYSVTVAAGSNTATCEVTFPYPACGTLATKCSGSLPMMAQESGCELPKDKQTFPKLRLGATPDEVQVTVKRGKTTLTDQKMKPTMEEFRPNGPQCGPVCKLGKLAVSSEPGTKAK